jgi:drug/metabolite transporter (DMT)-like permease
MTLPAVLQRLHVALQQRAAALPPAARGLLWSIAAGVIFTLLNTLVRQLSQQMDPFQAQFLRYAFGLLVLLPLVWHHGVAAYRPRNVGGQFARGALHTVGLCLWFFALPHIPLADTTAIGFTTPLFIMLGAWWVFKEPMRWERWLATGLGFAGVLVVVGPKLSLTGGADGGSGGYQLLMLASAPMFAASFLLTKALTRYETTGTILVWQNITVVLFSLPLALLAWRTPGPWEWAGFALSGVLGSAGHYCLTRSFAAADISATQSAKFLELVWAALLGWAVFGDLPTVSTMAGGALIAAATLWVARRESRALPRARGPGR